MKDPHTRIGVITNPFRKRDQHGYKPAVITIWHKDPSGHRDGCAFFIRSHHIDPVIVEKVRHEFEFNFKNNYWFDQEGKPKFSTSGTALEMYGTALWQILCHEYPHNHEKRGRIRDRFFRKHLHEILRFAENPVDSLYIYIHEVYGKNDQKYRVENFTSIITADIFRKRRPWWKHPAWHVHHWKVDFNFWDNLKRRYWDKCVICGKRGFPDSGAYSHGNGIAHRDCLPEFKRPVTDGVIQGNTVEGTAPVIELFPSDKTMMNLASIKKAAEEQKQIPRRNDLQRNLPAELAIHNAMLGVEGLGADERLTKAVMLMHEARNLVADFIDEKQIKELHS